MSAVFIRRGRGWAVPAIIFFAAGCDPSVMAPGGRPVSLPQNGEDVISAQNQFAFRLFKAALQEDTASSNKLISPLSIYLDLSMVYNGAAGATEDSMRQALQLSDTGTEMLNQTNQALIAGLPAEDPRVTLNIANSIWYSNQGPQPLASFLKTNDAYYQAQVAVADFSNSSATVNSINNWVASRTQQKIKTIIKSVDPGDIMFLVNAIYFKGQWTHRFDSKQTADAAFYTASSGIVQTPFMQLKDTLPYAGSDSLQLMELPYGNGDFSMYVLLPAPRISLPAFISALTEDKLQGYFASLHSTGLQLYLPKWEYSYGIDDLLPVFGALGMGIACRQGADFSGMYPSAARVYISRATHKTYIKVDEEGTEAAAVTLIGMGTTSVPAIPEMIVNRPFLYLITEKNSGAILFIGEVNNPLLSGNSE